ncbi:hypothetical protein [Maridesulfovibrio sp.]|uniref:hypothetical protein n=1 Tax=Maridesulfovibrio sp. TaxID=2795000 RepID=UPI003BAAD2FE
MYPLNYAILKHFTKVDEACAEDVMEALADQYSSFKAFKKPAIINALMTAEANGLLEESRSDLDSNQQLRVFYRAHAEGAATINKYIK